MDVGKKEGRMNDKIHLHEKNDGVERKGMRASWLDRVDEKERGRKFNQKAVLNGDGNKVNLQR